MLSIENLDVWLPDRGQVLTDVSIDFEPGTVTAIVGRNGAGSTTLLRACATRLPAGSFTRGRLLFGNADLLRGRVQGLADHLLVCTPELLPAAPVGRVLLEWCGAGRARTLATELGLTDHLDHDASQLPPDLKARVGLALLEAAPNARLVLIDHLGAWLGSQWRPHLLAAIERRRDCGAVVVWADHDLEAVWAIADRVAELDEGHLATIVPTSQWAPRRLPEPVLLGLARILGLPPAECRDTSQFRQAYQGSAIALPFVPAADRRPGEPPTTATIIEAERVGLRGATIEIGADECVGIICRDGRPGRVARKIATAIQASHLPSQLPAHQTPRDLVRSWTARQPVARHDPLSNLPIQLSDHRPLGSQGFGVAARIRGALLASSTGAVWAPNTQLGLDAAARRNLADQLATSNLGPRILTSHDTDFLVRACRQIMVVEDDRVVGLGAPAAVIDLLPTRPLVSAALGTSRYYRLGPVVSALAAGGTR